MMCGQDGKMNKLAVHLSHVCVMHVSSVVHNTGRTCVGMQSVVFVQVMLVMHSGGGDSAAYI